jgi:hypothetical protein
VPWGIAGPPCLWGSQIRRPGPPSWGLSAGLTIQPHKKVIVKKFQQKLGGQGPNLDVEPYGGDEY